MRAVVTGVAGFIGSHVATQLTDEGAEVLGIDDLSGGFEENIPKEVRFQKRSILDPLDDLLDAFKPRVIYHLAAYAAEGLSHHIPLFNTRNNLQGTANVLSAGYRAGVQDFVFTSSIAVYGHPSLRRPFSESDCCAPCDPYGVAKLACEWHIRSFFDYYGRPRYTIFRPHNVYGPRQNISDPFRNVVGIFMRNAIAGTPLPVFGQGTQTRSFTFVDEVASAIARAPLIPAASNATFNIGADESVSVIRLAELVAEAMGVPLAVEYLPPRKEVLHAHCSHEKALGVFKDLPAGTPLPEGLRRMALHVKRSVIPPVTPCPAPLEIGDCLPQAWRSILEDE